MSNEIDVRLVGNYTIELNQQGPPGAPGLGIASINEIGYDVETGEYSYRITYTDGTYYDFTIQGGARYTGSTGIIINNDTISVDTDVIATKNDLLDKQDVIDSSNKLSSDLVDDTGNTNKFATQSQLNQIGTNQSDISTINSKIPSEASNVNKLADKNYVDTNDTNLQDQINNLKARGRFLALWNCSTGLAETNPPQSPYVYQPGDYFIIGTVSSATPQVNYRPNGSSYTTGVASSTVETNLVDIDDVYYYDGVNWHLQINTQKTVSFVNIAGDPYDNTNLATALNDKQDTISDLSDIRTGASKGDTAVQPSDLATVATTGDYDDLLDKPTIPTVYDGIITLRQGGITKGSFTVNQSSNTTIDLDAGGSSITVDNALSNSSTNPVQNKIITNALDSKQDTLTAGDNIDIYDATFDKQTSAVASWAWRCMCYDGTFFLAISQSNGRITYSNTLLSWSDPSYSANLRYKDWYGVTYGDGKYVTISRDGYISTSTNKTTWASPTQITTTSGTGDWVSIAYGNNTFVALSRRGYISTSSDASTWSTPTQVSNLGDYAWSSLVYDGTKFVTLSGSGRISISTDGTTWTENVEVANLSGQTWYALAYGNGKYIAIASNRYISESTDAINWTVANSYKYPSSGNYYCLSYGNTYDGNKFVALSLDGEVTSWDGTHRLTINPKIDSVISNTSTNPVASKTIHSALNNKQNTISANSPLYKSGSTIGLNIDNQLDLNSTNPVANFAITQAINNIQPSISITGGNAINVSSGGIIDYNSPTQIHPNPDTTQSTQWHAFSSNGTVYVAGGEFGQVATSPDCTTWSAFNVPNITGTIVSIGYNSGRDAFAFAFGGNNIAYVDSTHISDQNAYMMQSSQNFENIHAVASNGMDFIFGGYDSQNNCGCVGYGDPFVGQIYMEPINGLETIVKIVVVNNMHIALDIYGNLAYRDLSSPIPSWQVVNVTSGGGGMQERLLGIAYNGTNYVTVTSSGNIWTTVSGDITQWQQSTASIGVSVEDFTSYGNTLYVVGNDFNNPNSGDLYVSDATNINFTSYVYQTMGSTYTVYADGSVLLIGCEWNYAILYGGAGGGYVINCIVDDHLDTNSSNPVENRVIAGSINNILDILQRNNIQ